MTTDERIDRLTERHEALTQSVELLLQATREHSQQITELMEAAASLLHVAEIHEQRISRLEGEGSQQQ
jgi:ABC-type transporter Mla subunit MlaD